MTVRNTGRLDRELNWEKLAATSGRGTEPSVKGQGGHDDPPENEDTWEILEKKITSSEMRRRKCEGRGRTRKAKVWRGRRWRLSEGGLWSVG